MVEGDDGETYAVMGDALVNLQFIDKRAGQGEVDILAVMPDGHDSCKFFDNNFRTCYINKSANRNGKENA